MKYNNNDNINYNNKWRLDTAFKHSSYSEV